MAGFPTISIIFKYNLKNGNMAVIDTWTKEQFLQCISDLYKEAFGVRPRGINYILITPRLKYQDSVS